MEGNTEYLITNYKNPVLMKTFHWKGVNWQKLVDCFKSQMERTVKHSRK